MMVIILGNSHGIPNSNLDEAVHIPHCAILPPAIGKWLGRLDALAFV